MFHSNNNNNFDGRFKKVKSGFPNFGRKIDPRIGDTPTNCSCMSYHFPLAYFCASWNSIPEKTYNNQLQGRCQAPQLSMEKITIIHSNLFYTS